MRLEDFDYDLPDAQIAQTPVEPRDSARLMVDRGAAAPDHRHVRDLPDELRAGDLLVVNDSKVIPARLRLWRGSGGAAEVLLLEPLDGDRRTWEAMVRPARKLRIGEPLFTADDSSLAIALQSVEARTCACGHDRVETTSPDAEFAFTAEAIRCHACAARERAASAFVESGGSTAGLLWAVNRKSSGPEGG